MDKHEPNIQSGAAANDDEIELSWFLDIVRIDGWRPYGKARSWADQTTLRGFLFC